MVALLETDSGQYTWVAASTGATNAAEYQLATGDPVIGIGGCGGDGAAPTLAQFQSYLAHGHYYIASGQGGGFGGGASGSAATPAMQIQAWVGANYASSEVDRVTIYDLITVTAP